MRFKIQAPDFNWPTGGPLPSFAPSQIAKMGRKAGGETTTEPFSQFMAHCFLGICQIREGSSILICLETAAEGIGWHINHRSMESRWSMSGTVVGAGGPDEFWKDLGRILPSFWLLISESHDLLCGRQKDALIREKSSQVPTDMSIFKRIHFCLDCFNAAGIIYRHCN